MSRARPSETGSCRSGQAPAGLDATRCDPARALEFRPDANGSFDEIVARFADGLVHVETMTDDSCYVGFCWDDGRYCQWWISSKKKLKYYHEDGIDEPPRFSAQGVDRKPHLPSPYAIAAGSGTDETSEAQAQAEGSQSGPKGIAQGIAP